MQLADAAGDQLGELAAEVEDDDRIGLADVGAVAVRSRRRGGRVERGLEIGLDLGVVGGEDAVAGVRGLAVDGLAALRRAGSVRSEGVSGSGGAAAAPDDASWSASAVRSANPPSSCFGPVYRAGPAHRDVDRDPPSRLRIASAAMSK